MAKSKTVRKPQPGRTSGDAGVMAQLRPAANRRRKPGRPSPGSRALLREHLLRSALNAFLLYGFEGMSFHALAQTSGISRDTLYRLYRSKEELFRAAAEFATSKLAAHLRVAVMTQGSVEDVLLRAALQINQDIAESVAVVRLLIAEAPRFPDVAARMFAESRVSLAPLVEYLEEQRGLGILEFEDGFEAAFMLSTLAFGGVRIFLEPAAVTGRARERWAKQVVATMLRGWQRR